MLFGVRKPWIALIVTVVCWFFLYLLDLSIVPRKYSGDTETDWTQFAYVQYVTDEHYLCNALMMLEALRRFDAKAERVVLYPDSWEIRPNADIRSRLLLDARELYGAKLVSIAVWTIKEPREDQTRVESYTKLLAFKLTQYKRVVMLNSDATLQGNMDELFQLPSTTIAMPRAYWLDKLSSAVIVLEPSVAEWERINSYAQNTPQPERGFDTDILNALYSTTCLVLPHRPYLLPTLEFGEAEHVGYLGADESWVPSRALADSKYIHFSGMGVPKPWLKSGDEVMTLNQPKCRFTADGNNHCGDREIWWRLYEDFRNRRKRICGMEYDEGDFGHLPAKNFSRSIGKSWGWFS